MLALPHTCYGGIAEQQGISKDVVANGKKRKAKNITKHRYQEDYDIEQIDTPYGTLVKEVRLPIETDEAKPNEPTEFLLK